MARKTREEGKGRGRMKNRKGKKNRKQSMSEGKRVTADFRQLPMENLV